jgi:hypothetical protein
MRHVLRFLASCIFCLPLLARPAALPGDLTGIWFDGNHPGWGVGLMQQNDTVFATLFTYDSNGAPSWNVAALQLALVPSIPIAHDLCGTVELSGTLYGTQWPSFGSASNPQGSVQAQAVGTLVVLVPTVLQGSGCDGNTVNIRYSIGSAQSSAAVTRETWSSNQARLYGQHAAGLVLNFLPVPCPPNAPSVDGFMPAGGLQLSMNVAANGPAGVRLFWGTGIDTLCQISGTYSQTGQLGAISGPMSCGPVGFPQDPLGSARVSNLHVSDAGFAGDIAIATSCPIVGTISGARRSSQSSAAIPGDVTGMWFDASHPGWGMSLAQQNDAVFATLFIYDSSGAPAWYVASRLENAGDLDFGPCASMSLTGPLYRTTWPSFGSATNPQGSMQFQSVGTMTVGVPTLPQGTSPGACDRNSAVVRYSIDGVQSAVTVTRQTWSSNQARLYGQFTGGVVFFPPASSCPDLNDYPTLPASGRQMTINGSADGPGVRLLWGTGIDTLCQISGTYSQGGQLGALTGSFGCGPLGGTLPSTAPIRLSSLAVSDSGFVADVALDMGTCHYLGTIAGARRP